jgi:hypothetical protein
MPISYENIQDFNRDIRDWGKETRQKLLYRIAQLDLKERAALSNELHLRESLKLKVKTRYGEAQSVGFTFARHGIFIERGVGRGVPLAKVATSNRTPKPWLGVVLPQAVEELADLVAQNYADDVAGQIRINIPGVYRTEIDL